jgi:hypothetical protein
MELHDRSSRASPLAPGDPDQTGTAVLGANPGYWGNCQISISSGLRLQVFGVQAEDETEVRVSVKGKEPRNANRSEWP